MRLTTRALASLALTLPVMMGALSSPASAKLTVHDRADSVLKHAAQQKGKPYRYGANGPGSFDCSGYVQYVYGKAGTKVGRTSGAQLAGRHIAKGSKKPGDILVFLRGGTAYHSAIYAGKGQMWEAQRTGVPVGRHKIWSDGYVVRRPKGGTLRMHSTSAIASDTSSPDAARSESGVAFAP